MSKKFTFTNSLSATEPVISNAGATSGPKKSNYKFNVIELPIFASNVQLTLKPSESVVLNVEDTKEIEFYETLTKTIKGLVAVTGYSITYKANGGVGADIIDSDDTYEIGAKIPVRTGESTQFTYEGKTFKNWNTKADGSGTTYDATSSTASVKKITITGNEVLYAQWQDAPVPNDTTDDEPTE